jgi:hypothetical protein
VASHVTSKTDMQWLAYLWREGHAPRPASVGIDRVIQLLEGADLEGMRRRYEEQLRKDKNND